MTAPTLKTPGSNPAHYNKLTPEPIDVITGWRLDFALGSVIKYVARAGSKPGEARERDLQKASDYLHLAIHGHWPWDDPQKSEE